jgi:quercetin dioxygenase-like cupin family protein
MKIYFPGGLCCLALCCSALAQNANTTAASSATAGQYTNADIAKALNVVKTNIVWQDSSFLKNVQVCWVMGEPNKENLIVELVKFPAHYQLPEHSHPYTGVN